MSSFRSSRLRPPLFRGRVCTPFVRTAAILAAGTLGCLFPSPLPAQRPSLTGPGVSATLARLRAAQVTDVAYDLALTVSAGDTATGRVTVSFTRRTRGDVVLDFRGLSVSEGRINGAA